MEFKTPWYGSTFDCGNEGFYSWKHGLLPKPGRYGSRFEANKIIHIYVAPFVQDTKALLTAIKTCYKLEAQI